jgi:hypothetical protein
VVRKDGDWWEGTTAEGHSGLFPANRVVEYEFTEEDYAGYDTTGATSTAGVAVYENNAAYVASQQPQPHYDQKYGQGTGQAHAAGNGTTAGMVHIPLDSAPASSKNAVKYRTEAASAPTKFGYVLVFVLCRLLFLSCFTS